MAHEYTFKYILLGDTGVGKSCLLHRLTKHEFKDGLVATMGMEFTIREVDVNGHIVRLEIWDTAGQERFRCVIRPFYRGTAGVFLVYDITSHETFDVLAKWLSDARNFTSPNTVIILIGTKADLEEWREVPYEEAQRFAEENGLLFLETSAKTGKNVEAAFLDTSKRILENIQNGIQEPQSSGSGIRLGPPRAVPQVAKSRCSWC